MSFFHDLLKEKVRRSAFEIYDPLIVKADKNY